MPSGQGIRAGAAYVELFVKDNRLVRGLRAAQEKLAAFGAAVRVAGTQLLTLGAGLAAPLAGSLQLFSSLGDSLAKASARTGIAVETLSELGYAADQSGASLETLEKGVQRMQRIVVEAADGSAGAVDALDRLGLSAQKLAGLAPDEQFRLIAERISKIKDPTQRAAAAMDVFGKSGTQLLPLMADGANGIRELEAEARRLGLTISADDAKAAETFGDRLDDLLKVLKRTVFTIGSALAPLATELAIEITKVATTISEWIKRNKTLVVTVAKIVAGVAAAGAVLVFLGTAIGGVGAAFGWILSVITGVGTAIGLIGAGLAALLSPVGLVIAGLTALAAYLLTSTEAGGEALKWLGSVFQGLKETALAAFQGIGDALVTGDLALAGRVLWLTLKMEWQKGVDALNQHWQAWKAFFLNVANEAVYGLAKFFADAWADIQVGWLETTHFLLDAWSGFTAGVESSWGSTVDWIAERLAEAYGAVDSEFDADAVKQQL
ncbi:MAG TPA: phage tail tape measure protein, partial [Pirellulales bacterium]